MATTKTASGIAHSEPARRRPSAQPMLDALEGVHGRTRSSGLEAALRQLENGDHCDRADACVAIRRLAKTDPAEARRAAPALMEAFTRWGPLTKCVAAEALHSLVAANGTPAGIISAESLRTLIKAANDARHPEVRETIVSLVRLAVRPAPVAVPTAGCRK